jgi:hypothetical protein
VDDDRLRPGERAAQAGQVLMVMEGIAAAPVDEANVRVGEPPPVEVERLARPSSMSATRANGMKSLTGLRPCGKVGGPTRIGARPM